MDDQLEGVVIMIAIIGEHYRSLVFAAISYEGAVTPDSGE
jgi:hypothetical protein